MLFIKGYTRVHPLKGLVWVASHLRRYPIRRVK